MNQTAFFRKVVYLGLMALLLLPLYWLSQPSTTATAEQPGSPGGALAQKREEFKLGQASLGKIDPAGETIRLATLGMRGIAANILWAKADEYKMKEDWTNLSATLEQIAYLQPNYIGVWQFQSWNLAYNVSYEFDDYRERYAWVIKGIEFLQKGIEYNANDPRLMSGVGWFAAHKIGRSDEHVQFRRLFREDDDFHRRQKIQQRDNWLFGKAYFLEAQRAVELGATMPASSSPVFYSRPAVAESNYAEALEGDHREALDAAAAAVAPDSEPAEQFEKRVADIHKRFRLDIPAAWESSATEWHKLGDRDFPTEGTAPYRLNDRDVLARDLAAAQADLEKFSPGARDRIREAKLAKLPADRRKALDIPPQDRTPEQDALANLAEGDTQVSYDEVAQQASASNRAAAEAAARRAAQLQEMLNEVTRGRENVNFDGWLARCDVELTDDARQARRWLHEGSMDFYVLADLPAARSALEKSFQHWRHILDKQPELIVDPTSFAMLDGIHVYEAVLKQMDEPFPKKFILQDMLDAEARMR
ncbi:MAG TPA: hypothetical protein VHY91_06505 [Pirellulales bacterium]|jgi:hypothetical protein|nr:hypothetical protein [Pirellulales bacterium]